MDFLWQLQKRKEKKNADTSKIHTVPTCVYLTQTNALFPCVLGFQGLDNSVLCNPVENLGRSAISPFFFFFCSMSNCFAPSPLRHVDQIVLYGFVLVVVLPPRIFRFQSCVFFKHFPRLILFWLSEPGG